MALVDPNIAMGYRGIEVPNQLAQYGQLAQIQNAQNQNQLAQYQLSSAQRADEQQNNLYAAAKQPGFALDFASALKYGAPGLAAFKAQQEAAASKLTQTKTQGEIDAQGIAAAQKRVDAFSTALAPLVSAVQSKKPITHDDVFGQATRLVAQGLLKKEDLASIPMNAAELPNFVMSMASSTENSRKALETYLPKALVAGGSVINQNPLAAGGIGNKLADVTMTPFENARVPILQQQANTSAGQLKVAQDRLAQDAQGVTYQPNDQGYLVALPSRLSAGTAPVARPVTGQDGAPVKGKPSAFAEKATAQRTQMGKDIKLAITEIEDAIKPGGLLEKSTASGAGKLADAGAAFFGQATPGAIAAASLKPIADLGLKMIPRFEGPQSDKDTASYKEAAGQLANEALPAATRKSAAQTMIRIMKARQGQFANDTMAAEGIAPSIAPPPGFTKD